MPSLQSRNQGCKEGWDSETEALPWVTVGELEPGPGRPLASQEWACGLAPSPRPPGHARALPEHTADWALRPGVHSRAAPLHGVLVLPEVSLRRQDGVEEVQGWTDDLKACGTGSCHSQARP